MIRDRFGLRITGGGDLDCWPPLIFVEQTKPVKNTGQEELSMPKDGIAEERQSQPKSKLAFVLDKLNSQALAHPGKIQTHELKSGLTVKVNCEIDGTTRLLLARDGVYPSDTEFTTVMANWPYDPPLEIVPEKTESQNGKIFGLRAKWETPK